MRQRTRRALAVSSLVVVSGFVTQAWADVKFQPSVSLGATYVDNIDLAPPGAPKSSDLIWQLVPRVLLEQKGPRFSSALDYSAQALFFRDRSELNATYHNGQANASWVATPNLLFVDGWASYRQQTIDPTQPSNAGNLFSVGNTADEFSALLSPYLRRDFGQMTGLLRYTASTSRYYGISQTASASLQNSSSSVVTAQLAADDTAALFAWSLDGRSARTTFDVAAPFRSDRVSAEGSVGVAQSLRLIASAGAETNILKSSSTGGLDAGFWSAGIKWTPGPATSIEARIGHRFFGTDYSLNWTHEGRLLVFQASYNEEPTTTGQSDSLTGFVPGQIASTPQAYTDVLRSNTTYSPYLRKQLDASVELRGRRTQIVLHGYYLRRDYFDAVGTTDLTQGGEFTLKRDLSDRATAGVSASIDDVKPLNLVEYRDHRYAFDLAYKMGKTLTATLRVVHLQRDGDFEYRANIGQLSLQKTF